MGMKNAGGEIVQVQGGHILRSTGRKDRHSKVFTAKGPRDRRVRLSAHTAIQFYDVQDRLGYDRPSKAIDWLIKKAKSAIDKLAELPPWHLGEDVNTSMDVNRGMKSADVGIGDQLESSGYNFQLHRQLSDNLNTDSNFLSQSMVPDSIPDTMKPFFPTSSNGGGASMTFHSYHDPDVNPRPDEDLGLSLHSFQNQSLIHRQSQADANHHTGGSDHALFPGSGHEEFDTSFHRVVAWSNETNSEDRPPAASVFGGFGFNQTALTQQQLLLSQHGSEFSQRGPLQSSFLQSIHAWNDLSMPSVDHNRQQDVQQSLVVGSRFASEGLSAFSFPVRIHGEEEQSVLSDMQPSSSPNSQH